MLQTLVTSILQQSEFESLFGDNSGVLDQPLEFVSVLIHA